MSAAEGSSQNFYRCFCKSHNYFVTNKRVKARLRQTNANFRRPLAKHFHTQKNLAKSSKVVLKGNKYTNNLYNYTITD